MREEPGNTQQQNCHRRAAAVRGTKIRSPFQDTNPSSPRRDAGAQSIMSESSSSQLAAVIKDHEVWVERIDLDTVVMVTDVESIVAEI